MPGNPTDRLHTIVEGDPARPALLLLHGFLSCHLQWEPNLAGLLERFRLVRPELWGHGASPEPEDAKAWRVAHYVAQLETVRKSLGLDLWFVCGQSFGAGVITRYAHAHPEAVSGLIITNSRAAFRDETAERPPARTLEEWREAGPASLPFHPRHAKRFPPDLKQRLTAAADAVSPYALWRSMSITVPELSCRAVAQDITVPTLLINGQWEKIFQPARDFAAATIPNIKVVDLAGGHAINIEQPDAFNTAVLEFADRCAAASD